MSLRLIGLWPAFWICLLSIGLGWLAWCLYRREIREAVSPPWGWVLPTLRALSVGLIAFTLAEPMIERRRWVGQPSPLVFAIDASASMKHSDSPGHSGTDTLRLSRYERALHSLLGSADDSSSIENSHRDESWATRMPTEAGLVRQLDKRFLVSLHRVEGNSQTPKFYDSEVPGGAEQLASRLRPESWSDTTSLGDALHTLAQQYPAERNPIYVLLSDGQNNAGPAVLSEAEKLQQAGVKIFCVGYGSPTSTNDLAILSAEIPGKVYREETLSGRLFVREQIASGQSYTVKLNYGDACVWQREVVSEQNLQRSLAFTFPAKSILDIAIADREGQNIELASLPVRLTASVSTNGELHLDNNHTDLFTTLTVEPAKVLLIDGRSRWETRYLKNLFDRDPAWELTSWIDHQNDGDSDSENELLPNSREQLFEYNLIILGDVQPDSLGGDRIKWIVDFVDEREGGLILVDGRRRYLRDRGFQALHELLPIQWKDGDRSLIEGQPALTSRGRQVEALRLDGEQDNNNTFSSLAPLQFVSRVERRPGAEILITANNALEETPLMIFRRYGAGRVLFVASDELWRWRYAVADQIHTRLWNQLANWIMAKSLSFAGEFVSLDSGKPSYERGETIEIRSQLRRSDGRPKSEAGVSAILNRMSDDGSQDTWQRVPLQEDPNVPGSYSCSVSELPAGTYRVRLEVPGYPSQALSVESQFTVLGASGAEQREITCNTPLLQEIATTTGGEYFPQQAIDSLAEELKPLSQAEMLVEQYLLWQSFVWFTVALCLLAIEWVIRKQIGLV